MKNRTLIFLASLPVIGPVAGTDNAAAADMAAGRDRARPDTQKPNIIYIMTDQQWAGAMSCAGNPDLETPNMDRLAENGIRFTNAYCSFPLSGPSRAAMFTGYMPSESGVVENEMPLPDSLAAKTLGTVMSDAGYDCAYAGKWHVNTISLPGKEAFGFHNIKGNGDRGIAEACIEYLRSRPSDRPFFLVASYTNPHNICEFARGQNTPHAKVEQADTRDCPNLPANFAVAPYDADILRYEKSLDYSLYPTAAYSPDDWRQYRNAYFRLVEAVDAEIGKIIDEIDRQGLWENTVIIFTSDHGEELGDHYMFRKSRPYEGSCHIPMLFSNLEAAGISGRAGSRISSVVELRDIMPTLLDIAGARDDEHYDGKSLTDVIAGRKDTVRDYLHGEHSYGPFSNHWIVTEKDKYIWMSESGADIDISLRQPAFLHARYHETKKRQTPRIIVSEVLVGPRAKNSAMAAMGENAI